MTRVKIGVALSVLVLVGAAVSCGRAGGEVLSTAGRTTTEAGTSRLVLSIVSQPLAAAPGAAEVGAGTSPPTGFRLTGEGLLHYRSGEGLMRFDLSAMGPGLAGEAEIRMVDEAVYVKVPGAGMGGRPWLKMAAEETGEDPLVPGLQRPIDDPRAILDVLQGAGEGVEEVGRGSVRGSETRHLRAEIDLAEAAKRLPPERQGDFEALRERFGRPTLPVEAWVDDEGLVRRLRYSLEVEGMLLRVELELFDFGVEVEVEPPPMSQVTEFGELDTGR